MPRVPAKFGKPLGPPVVGGVGRYQSTGYGTGREALASAERGCKPSNIGGPPLGDSPGSLPPTKGKPTGLEALDPANRGCSPSNIGTIAYPAQGGNGPKGMKNGGSGP